MKSADSGELYLMCDDCESQWRSPQEAESFENAPANEARVVPASSDEVERAGWNKFVK